MVKWELMPKNPAIYATVPKYKSAKREIWTAETLMHALEVCEDERLKLALNLAFSCSMRMGEMLGLTWDCVDISDEAIEEGRAGRLRSFTDQYGYGCVYSHIIDDDRRKNAELFEEAFYEKKDLDPSMHAHAAGKTVELPTDVDAELLAKVLSNPEMAALLSTLAKSLEKK